MTGWDHAGPAADHDDGISFLGRSVQHPRVLGTTQRPGPLGRLDHACLTCAVRCGWLYNDGALERDSASRLATVLAAFEGGPTAIEVLQAASEMLGGVGATSQQAGLVQDVLSGEYDSRQLLRRHRAALKGLDAASCDLIYGLVEELAEVEESQRRSWRSPPPLGSEFGESTGFVVLSAPGVGGQIERLEIIENEIEESARRLANVKLQLAKRTSRDMTAASGGGGAGGTTGTSIRALRERCSAVDAHVEVLVQRSSKVTLQSASSVAQTDQLRRIRELLLDAASETSLGDGALSATSTLVTWTEADWRRVLLPGAEAGRLTWPAFRKILSTLLGMSGASDLAVHVLFDTLEGTDIACTDSVGVDELYKFISVSRDEYLLEAQCRFTDLIQESRAESAGLKAWIASKVAQEKANAPTVGHQGRFQLELEPTV